MAPAPPPPQPPSAVLSRALAVSSDIWQTELKNLFDQAKTRYPDVVWDMVADDDDHLEEIWGHKAIVYARAPPSFQARYFTPRTTSSNSPTPYSRSIYYQRNPRYLYLSRLPMGGPVPRSPSPFGAPQRTQSPVHHWQRHLAPHTARHESCLVLQRTRVPLHRQRHGPSL
ncbi:CAP-Gly domain protein [Ceratobasidium sp. AG-Ba]|nr:CAP-Gly domain protein [Ceratobasidium sp. AG-Ba]